MSNFTPGPWVIFNTGSINMVLPAMRDGMIADLIDNEANAHLIAAAPDLLAALLNLIGAVDGGGYPHEAMKIARAAISRATPAPAREP